MIALGQLQLEVARIVAACGACSARAEMHPRNYLAWAAAHRMPQPVAAQLVVNGRVAGWWKRGG